MGDDDLTLPPTPAAQRAPGSISPVGEVEREGETRRSASGEGEVYTGYAPHYDRQGQSQWGLALLRFTFDTILPRFGRQPQRALDLACGTGTVAVGLAALGMATVGLDRSRAMLAVARAKAARAGVDCAFVRADLRAFAFSRPFDLITCCYDSLNYLTDPRDLGRAFANARAALAPGGLFVCDLTTALAYTSQGDRRHTFALGDIAYAWTVAWDPDSRLAATTIAVVARAGDRTERAVERHVQRAYERDEVEALLRRAGLRPLAAGAALPLLRATLDPPGPDTVRIIYVAEPAPINPTETDG